MVAVSLSEEVRPLPLPTANPNMQEVEVVATPATTGAASTTGIDSVDDHIARLKANARQHVDRELRGGDKPSSTKSPYLPSKEVAKTIKCRFFPNCYYGDNCMFYHPSSSSSAPHQAQQAAQPYPTFYQQHQQPVMMANGNGTMFDPAMHSPQNGGGDALPLSPNGTMIPEEYMNGNNGYNGYYIPNVYDASNTNGSTQNPTSPTSTTQANQYYGFVPYQTQNNGGYTPYPQSHPSAYYSPPQNGYQSMYIPQQPSMHEAQYGSPVANSNGVLSPSGSNTAAVLDPAIIAQGPESAPDKTQEDTVVNGVSGDDTTASVGMEKSLSNQSGKSSSSFKSKKAKKAAAGAGLPEQSAQEASSLEPHHQAQAQEFIPMHQQQQYYGGMGMPMMPSEMMMMSMPPPPHVYQQQHPSAMHMVLPPHASQMHGGATHFQPNQHQHQAYGTFGDNQNTSMNGGQSQPQSGGSSTEHDIASPSSNAAPAVNGGQEKKLPNDGHERIPSLTNGQLHTFFQTSGENVSPSSSSLPSANANTARNGASASAPKAMNAAPATHSNNTRFNPSSSTSNGPNNGPMKRFPPSQFSPTGAPLPRSGPVSNPNNITSRRNNSFANGGAMYESSKPTLPCRYFESRSCRYGDLCHYTHLLSEERAIPAAPSSTTTNGTDGEGNTTPAPAGPARMTRDARLLGLNIGSPDGRISEKQPINPSEFGPSHQNGNGPSARRLTLNGHNGGGHHHHQHQQQQPNGFGIPNVNAKGRFVHPAQPSTQAFSASVQQQQQGQAQGQHQQNQTQSQQGQSHQLQQNQSQQDQQKQQQIAALAASNSADAQEKIQRLISETRNLPSSIPPPPQGQNGNPRSNGPRPNGPGSTSQALGRRPPPHAGAPRSSHASSVGAHTHSQRVPSGENDFPALAASAGPAAAARASSMERSASASSNGTKGEVKVPLAPVATTASAEVKKEETPAPAQAQSQSTTPAPAVAAPAAVTQAPAKPAFSWASAAAKAASLPTPPPKRPVSKARPSAKEAKENNKASKAEKAANGEKKEKEKETPKEKEKELATPASAPAPAKTAAAVVAGSATPASIATSEPVSAAAQTITAESTAAPALTA